MRFTNTVKPTLSARLMSIQNRHPGPEQPPLLPPPPPNTIMDRLSMNRIGNLIRSFLTKAHTGHRLHGRAREAPSLRPEPSLPWCLIGWKGPVRKLAHPLAGLLGKLMCLLPCLLLDTTASGARGIVLHSSFSPFLPTTPLRRGTLACRMYILTLLHFNSN